jgi:hypothetical protein
MRFATAALTLLTLAATPLFADLTITSKVTKDGGDPQSAISYISGDHVRMAQPDGNQVIVDFTTSAMTMVDSAKKQYWTMTKADWDALAARMNEAMNSPEMKNMPPEMQQKMEAMMGGMMKVDVQKTGNTRTIAGYKCEEFNINIGTFSKSTECVTDSLKLPAQSWAKYREFTDRLKTMMAAMGPMMKSVGAMQEQLKKVHGFPVASNTTVSIMGHTSTSTSEVTSVKEGAIDASVWQVPAGYTKVDSPLQKAMARRH